uniref:Malate dehydrogenase n=1 Tax=Parascaris equorum TaxID=6256 RepID=A0A914RQI8_PAREQ
MIIYSLNRLASQALLRPNGVLAAVVEVKTINVHPIPRLDFNFRRHLHALKAMANPGDKIVEVQEIVSHNEILYSTMCGFNTWQIVDMYIRDVKENVCKRDGEPVILKERSASAWVDGNNLLGPVVGNFCMDLAIKKAKNAGVGWVVAKGSNHFGIAGWYSMRAMKQGLMVSNFPRDCPSAIEAIKPCSPRCSSAVEIAMRREQKVPDSWGVAAGGKPSTEPAEILNGGYKGYGLGALGQCFIAIDPEGFAPNFSERLQEFMDTMRKLKPRISQIADQTVLIAGDPERNHTMLVEQCGGIPYHPNQIKFAV